MDYIDYGPEYPTRSRTAIIVFITGLVSFLMTATSILASGITTNTEVKTITETVVEPAASQIEFAPEQIPAEMNDDLGEIVDGYIPTVEAVDGGKFEDASTGLSLAEGQYADLGAIESVDTSTLENFVNDVLGRCIIANNIYGAQCVSLARAFWWSYANRDVSTCGTGLAKGMMDCAEKNAGDEFKVIWSPDEIIAGAWIVTGGSYTGHICQALGKVSDGYVACLGENQGGKSCGDGVGGAATNVINLSAKNFIGGYLPKTYIPVPIAPDTGLGEL